MAGEDRFERVGDLADRGARPRRLDRQRQQIALAALRRRRSARRARPRTAAASRSLAHPVEPGDLRRRAPRRCRHRGCRPAAASPERYLLTPTMTSSPRSIARLAPRRGFLDAQFRHAALDRLGHAAQRLDLVDQRHRRRGDRMRQALDVIAAAERVDDMRDAGLLGEDQLGVARDPAPRTGSAGPAPRRTSWCAATGCRRAPPPAPRSSCG